MIKLINKIKNFLRLVANFSKFIFRLIRNFIKTNELKSNKSSQERRLEICQNCECYANTRFLIFWKRPQCDIDKGGCGCNLIEKTKWVFESCPYEKW